MSKVTPNQNIRPITTKINEKGHIEIGGCDLVEIAKEFSTPLYIYDEETIRQLCKSYKDAFKDCEKVHFLFASKAFMTKAIVQILHQEGFGFDVVSGGEMYTVANTLGTLESCIFNGNNKTYQELEMALNFNIKLVSVDNFDELKLLNEVASDLSKNVDILLRITPGIECHTHKYIQTGHLDSKFGFDLTQLDEAISLIKSKYPKLNLKGLHAHIGSQIFETAVYYDEVEIILNEIVRIEKKHNIKLDEINLGGGLGINYTDEDKAPSVFEIAEKITTSLKENVKKLGIEMPTIFIEPGRSIVGTAGVTLYKAGSFKNVPNGKKYVALDGGMADNPRPSLYQAKYSAVVANKANEKNSEKVTLAGRFCESGDILINDIELPKIEKDDLVCIFTTGAYGYSMSSNYNRVLKPACVFLKDGEAKLAIKRETYKQLIQNDLQI